MTHRAHHPQPVEGCMGCKVLGLGFDGRTTTRTRRDELGASITEHRDGRQDVTIQPRQVVATTRKG